MDLQKKSFNQSTKNTCCKVDKVVYDELIIYIKSNICNNDYQSIKWRKDWYSKEINIDQQINYESSPPTIDVT